MTTLLGLILHISVAAWSKSPESRAVIPTEWPIEGPISIHQPSRVALTWIRAAVPFLSIDALSEREGAGPMIHIETGSVSGLQLVEMFLQQDPRYEAIVEGDFLVIMPSAAVHDSAYPLNLVVDRVSLERSRMSEIAEAIRSRTREFYGIDLDLRFAHAGGPPDEANIAVQLSSKTVRHILMEAAALRNQGVEFTHYEWHWFNPNGFGRQWEEYSLTGRFPGRIQAVLDRRRRSKVR